MLGVLLNIAPDSVNKGLELTQALTKKGLEFFLGDGDVSLILYFLLVLLPAIKGSIFKRGGGKWHPILTLGPGGGKMVLTLLEEVIALQVSFTLIHVRGPGFKRPLMRVFILLRYRSRRKSRRSKMQNGLEDPLKVILRVLAHRRQSKNDQQSNSESGSTWHNGGVITLSGNSASKFFFAAKRKILRKSVAIRRMSH